MEKHMIERVISGGQTGADQAGWRAAKAAGIATGGWMPKGFKTEDGLRPEFAALYGAKEYHSEEYPPRTRHNLAWCGEIGGRDSAMAICFDAGKAQSPGTRCLVNAFDDLMRRDKPCPTLSVIRLVPEGGSYRLGNDGFDPEWCAWAIDHTGAAALLVAGNRESSAPGIGAWVESYLAEVFQILRA